MSSKTRSAIATYLIAAGSSLFFCSKGVFAKAAYAHGANVIDVLALRMGIALPFFAVVAWVSSRHAVKLTAREWGALAGLGFLGYYVSSFVNFSGLQFITVGLERIVLFTYPSLVLIGSVLFKGQPLRRSTVLGVIISYAGIIVAFGGEAGGRGGFGETALGVGLVFTSAVTYAIFITTGADLATRLGPWRFTAFTVGFSCLFILIHHTLTRPAGALLTLPTPVYWHGATLAIFGTVIPSFLLGIGLKRAGAQKFAVIGTAGPVVTFLLAWAVLDEIPNLAQVAGFVLALAGGLWVTFQPAQATQKKSTPSR